MSDEAATELSTGNESNAGKWILLVLAVIYVAALYFFFDLRGRLDSASKQQITLEQKIADLTKRIQSAEAADETLAHQVGMTKRELADRSAELQRQQKAAEARLAEHKSSK